MTGLDGAAVRQNHQPEKKNLACPWMDDLHLTGSVTISSSVVVDGATRGFHSG